MYGGFCADRQSVAPGFQLVSGLSQQVADKPVFSRSNISPDRQLAVLVSVAVHDLQEGFGFARAGAVASMRKLSRFQAIGSP